MSFDVIKLVLNAKKTGNDEYAGQVAICCDALCEITAISPTGTQSMLLNHEECARQILRSLQK